MFVGVVLGFIYFLFVSIAIVKANKVPASFVTYIEHMIFLLIFIYFLMSSIALLVPKPIAKTSRSAWTLMLLLKCNACLYNSFGFVSVSMCFLFVSIPIARNGVRFPQTSMLVLKTRDSQLVAIDCVLIFI